MKPIRVLYSYQATVLMETCRNQLSLVSVPCKTASSAKKSRPPAPWTQLLKRNFIVRMRTLIGINGLIAGKHQARSRTHMRNLIKISITENPSKLMNQEHTSKKKKKRMQILEKASNWHANPVRCWWWSCREEYTNKDAYIEEPKHPNLDQIICNLEFLLFLLLHAADRWFWTQRFDL